MLPNLKLLITNYKLRNKGFTLIEMLVVIAIISILIGIGINTFTIAQQKARDVRRKADLRQIQTLLTIYGQDHPGAIFGALPNWISSLPGDTNWTDNGLIDGGYTTTLPVDPKNTNDPSYGGGSLVDWNGTDNYYEVRYLPDGAPTKICIATRLENTSDPDTCNNQATATNKNPNVDCTTPVPVNSTYRICVPN